MSEEEEERLALSADIAVIASTLVFGARTRLTLGSQWLQSYRRL